MAINVNELSIISKSNVISAADALENIIDDKIKRDYKGEQSFHISVSNSFNEEIFQLIRERYIKVGWKDIRSLTNNWLVLEAPVAGKIKWNAALLA